MCMLFIKPKNLLLPVNYHNSLWACNSDGVSIYNKDTHQLFKTLDKQDTYNYLIENQDSELIVHYRFGTSGNNTLEQLHGFELQNNWLFFHNGVLSTFKGNELLSDTQQLVNYFNVNNFDEYEIKKYLEMNEKSSRFLLVNRESNEVITPDCALWNEAIDVNGYDVSFSNTYAIDSHLLKDDQYDSYDFNDRCVVQCEIDSIIENGDYSIMVDYVQRNPELIADYLMGYI